MKSQLKNLGHKVSVPKAPSSKILETFDNPGVQDVTFQTGEFTSLCPVTGQPDWVNVHISYSPDKLCIESKSLKLYLQSFRNESGFMEQLSKRIYNDLREVIKPRSLFVTLKCTPRGGLTLEATTYAH